MDSQRLIAYSEKFGHAKQNELVEELFNNYFVEEKFLGDRSVLLAAANKCGIDGAEDFLADANNGQDEVMEQLSFSNGVSGKYHCGQMQYLIVRSLDLLSLSVSLSYLRCTLFPHQRGRTGACTDQWWGATARICQRIWADCVIIAIARGAGSSS